MMKKYLMIFLTIFISMELGAWAALKPSESDEFNGQEAPLFTFQSLGGDSLSLEGFKGHPILLNFFASWCPPCRQEVSELMKLHKKYSPEGLVIIGVASDSKLIPETSKDKERSDVVQLSKWLSIPYPIESSVTVHFWLALFLFAITFCRFLMRWWKGSEALQGRRAWIYGLLSLIGIWSLFAMSYVGGLVSHN
ncbi:MAG: TlpA family protein disulfide reductase [Chlamydiae bacterium]|nr:TlpA family protein disulfide reductase [Chlamydiota bacterium]MBI3276372.1 TlpA family protein disulfide reductase [Chlamydiota bacterium]